MDIIGKSIQVKVNEAGVANQAKKSFKMSYCLTDYVMPRRRTDGLRRASTIDYVVPQRWATSYLDDGLRCVSTQKNLFVKPFKNLNK